MVEFEVVLICYSLEFLVRLKIYFVCDFLIWNGLVCILCLFLVVIVQLIKDKIVGYSSGLDEIIGFIGGGEVLNYFRVILCLS